MDAPKLSLTHVVAQPRQPGPKPPLLLLLHGVGANEQDLIGLAPYADPRFLVISARAPRRYSYGGFAWFDLNWHSGGFSMDPEQVREAWEQVQRFVGEAVAAYGADPERVYLAGFSQGAIVSLGATLTKPELVAGLVVMSGRWMPELGPQADAAAIAGLPVIAVHGLRDQVIPVQFGRAIRDFLATQPVKLEYREYPMAHEVSLESLGDISSWLTARLDQPRRLAASSAD
ncbi:MAG TPA: alpha/beta fold hydrolase [Herpetosiphonaceae bacterium]